MKKIISAALCATMLLGTAALTSCDSYKKTPSDFKLPYSDYNLADYVTLGEYKGLEYTEIDTTVTSDQIDAKIKELLSDYTTEELNELDKKDISNFLKERGMLIYKTREADMGAETMREVERVCLLKTVDRHWMDHIDAMEELKRGIYLRSYGQKDPVVEYRFEGFAMFDEMIAAIREETVRMVLTVPVRVQRPPQREQVMKPDAPNAGAQTPYKNKGEKIGRNDPCPCGSGKKYKNCCGKDE